VYHSFQKDPSFVVGQVPVYGDLILAPMDGYSDHPMRVICRRLGSAMSYTEFINAREVLGAYPHIEQKYSFIPEERPVVFQLLDHDPSRLLEVAIRLEAFKPDMIDINMGCPERGIAARGAGAGLLRSPLTIARIFRRLHSSLSVPLAAKIRLGWEGDDLRAALLAARIVEENGGVLIAVHGRTKRQGYQGTVNIEGIAEIRQAVNIPVIANGDVKSVVDIEQMKAQTGCPAVMIGRAAIGNPWIFSRMNRNQVSPSDVLQTMLDHLELMMSFYGAPNGLIYFRKHTTRYLIPYTVPVEIRRHLLTTIEIDEFVRVLKQILGSQA
jgi:nifR3 family TIM-barrel protein